MYKRIPVNIYMIYIYIYIYIIYMYLYNTEISCVYNYVHKYSYMTLPT